MGTTMALMIGTPISVRTTTTTLTGTARTAITAIASTDGMGFTLLPNPGFMIHFRTTRSDGRMKAC